MRKLRLGVRPYFFITVRFGLLDPLQSQVNEAGPQADSFYLANGVEALLCLGTVGTIKQIIAQKQLTSSPARESLGSVHHHPHGALCQEEAFHRC